MTNEQKFHNLLRVAYEQIDDTDIVNASLGGGVSSAVEVSEIPARGSIRTYGKLIKILPNGNKLYTCNETKGLIEVPKERKQLDMQKQRELDVMSEIAFNEKYLTKDDDTIEIW